MSNETFHLLFQCQRNIPFDIPMNNRNIPFVIPMSKKHGIHLFIPMLQIGNK